MCLGVILMCLGVIGSSAASLRSTLVLDTSIKNTFYMGTHSIENISIHTWTAPSSWLDCKQS